MILERFYDEALAQASYLIACPATGEALVVDPLRDVEPYLRYAQAHGLRIRHVTETHIHADFVSGTRELAARTGARVYLSDAGDEAWTYAFASRDGATLLRDGDAVVVGRVRVQAIHTPGHTPEHLSFAVTDLAGGAEPFAVLTGDFLFAGDVGRPDLLEKAAGQRGTTEAAARALFRSVQRFRSLPDHWLVLPGHGAGSACGKAIGGVPATTLGYEKRFNWAFQIDDEDAFVAAALAGQPEPPKYFAQMKRINKEGPRVVGGVPRPPRLPDDQLAAVLREGGWVIDTRPAAVVAQGHLPGTINLPLGRGFATWAGWLVPYDRPFYLILEEECDGCVDQAARSLFLIGLDGLVGYFGARAIEAAVRHGATLARIPAIEARELAEGVARGDLAAVDVRGETEWAAGHVPGAVHIPLGYLVDRRAEVPRDRPVAVYCQSGGRSAIAASLLRALGFERVVDVRGGFAAWRAQSYPVARPGGDAALTIGG